MTAPPRPVGRLSARLRLGAALLTLLVVSLSACHVADVDGADPSADGSAINGALVVFAANGLTEPFEELATQMEQDHGVEVVLNLAAASTLATQIQQGAAADIFASSNKVQMEAIIDDGLASEPVVFIKNTLEIAVEPGNPLGIMTLADLARSDVQLVLGAPQVPVGKYARQALAKAGVQPESVSIESDVRRVRTRVALGEADAAIIYRSETLVADGSVEGIPIPDHENVVATYYLAILDDAPNPAAASAFAAQVTGEHGQQILESKGFMRP